MTTIPAASVRKGDVVRLVGKLGRLGMLTVTRVLNSDPRPGLITWELAEGQPLVVAANARVLLSPLSPGARP